MNVTIKDVAKAAGVSYSTVSKALRNSPLVKEPTKKKIIRIANELGYQPNVAARSLVSKKSQTIGVVWPTIERVAHSALVTQVNRQLERMGYTTLISINEMEEAINTFNRFQVDTILVFNDNIVQHHYPSNIPILTYGIANENSLYPTIDVNRGEAIKLAVSHLHENGHHRIYYIGDLNNDCLQQEKVQAFQEMIKTLNLDQEDNKIISVNGLEQHDGYLAARSILQQHKSTYPTAIIGGSHDLTRGILQATHEYNLMVPKDLTIVSYDNIPQTEDLETSISIVGVPLESITEKISTTLIQMAQDQEVNQSIHLIPEILTPTTI